jgi:hypothetical protein
MVVVAPVFSCGSRALCLRCETIVVVRTLVLIRYNTFPSPACFDGCKADKWIGKIGG